MANRSGNWLKWVKAQSWIFLVAGISGFFNDKVPNQDALLIVALTGIALLLCYRKVLFGQKRKAAPKASAAPVAASTSGKAVPKASTTPAAASTSGKAVPKASATPAAASTSGTVRASISIEGSGRTLSYKLAGVTFQGRQKWLKKIARLQEDYEPVMCELEPFEWKGSPACRVLAYLDDEAEPVDIGNIPAAAAASVCKLIDRVASVDVEVYGGPEYEGDDKSYGAEVTITIK